MGEPGRDQKTYAEATGKEVTMSVETDRLFETQDKLIEARRALVDLAEAASYVICEHDHHYDPGEGLLGPDVERLRKMLTDPRTRAAVQAASPLRSK